MFCCEYKYVKGFCSNLADRFQCADTYSTFYINMNVENLMTIIEEEAFLYKYSTISNKCSNTTQKCYIQNACKTATITPFDKL